ncbi:hypothetical protein DPEC_G00316440 [Dallia pectoralis]|uniref:Uncharacterized protein n=1 Tax=Dallia pectoralis TaxID=75939 RepID=A0ACC2FCR4_DALPE|nr:hypothetical protein DPEC_G00316440 [Dallia pectoralis]
MSHHTDEPRFTIEQIDLLQRLRRTGMTKPEILQALETLDRLDRQHGHKFGRRAETQPQVAYRGPTSNSQANTTLSSSSNNNTATSSTSTAATQTGYRGNGSGGSSLSPSPSNNYDMSPPLPTVVSAPAAMAPVVVAQNGRGVGGSGELVAMMNGKLSPPRFAVGGGGAVVMGRGYGLEGSEEELDVDDKVEELMRRDSAIIKEEIKAFLGNRRISQAVVAQVTGISQSRISHWLLQQGSDLSEQKKRAFYRWYQLEKTTPGATLTMRPAPVTLEDVVEWQQTPPPISSAPGSFRLRRGSRFTWRKECLSVMESYFNQNQYPDEAKREEISNSCNAVIQKPGKKLSDLERVTSLKVYNWFANRRKEIKRRANIAILDSHGMDVQSPGGHSNSDEIDGNDFTDQGCDVPGFEKRAVTRPLGLSRLDLSSPTQDDASTNNSNALEHQDPIALAVEMAAVNHSILALATQAGGELTLGGTRSDIKTEVLDND